MWKRLAYSVHGCFLTSALLATFDDQQHYQRITVALRETIRLMSEIDALIPEWPLT